MNSYVLSWIGALSHCRNFHKTNTLFCYPALLWFWKWLCSHWLGRLPCSKWWCESQIWIQFCKYTSVKTFTWVWGEAAVQTAVGPAWLGSVGQNLFLPSDSCCVSLCSEGCSKWCNISLGKQGKHLAVQTAVQPRHLSWVPAAPNHGGSYLIVLSDLVLK